MRREPERSTSEWRASCDGLLVVRAELCERLETLQRAAGRTSVRDMVQGISGIRTIAAAYGLVPVVALANALERAILSQPRGSLAGLYLDRLRDAIGCEGMDEAASQSLLASVSVRLT